MRAEVLSIGDEMTTGQRLDTNSQWLSQRLGELGIRVAFHTTMGDDLADNVQAFRIATERADIVVATGGLGPTADDLTREALAALLGVELVEDAASLAHIRQLFARRQRPMPERNVVQAQFPRGSRVVPNPHGTAPGIDLDVPRPGRSPSRVVALPGVPAEMREMWEATVGPALAGRGHAVHHLQVRCFGVGESDLEQMLPDLIRRGRDPLVGITVSQATITLRLTAAAESEEAFREHIRPTLDVIHQCLGPLVFGYGDDELQHAIVRMLRSRGETVSVVEWGTAGLLATWLAEADPTGETFRGGLVMRDASRASLLGLPAASFEPDLDPALLADACRRHFATDVSVVVGPFPPLNTQPPGHFRYAVSVAGQIRAKSATFAGHPDIVLHRAGKQALDLLRLRLAEGVTSRCGDV